MFSSFFNKASCQASQDTTLATPIQADNSQKGLVKSLVAGRQIAAAAIAEGDSCEFGSAHYFALCGLGGRSFFKQNFFVFFINFVSS